jgi:primosomal protein N'
MIRDRYRFRLMPRSETRPPLRKVLARLVDVIDSIKGGVRASFDVDPVHML